ncbi:SRPBCC family protein [Sphingobacterium sp. UBA6320]|uniref:SRPBCC family protein n=1 Tax=Sphingobacterium sp. UBA6320 TaxID=1947510 RepID=UPI0025CC593C|nr:SRPBCC family protein [Sphingobacterium sp. UBA6320]
MNYKQNISKTERIVTILSSSYLLYKSLSGKKKDPALAVSSALLLLRGSTAFCPLYERLGINHTNKPSDVLVESVITVNSPRQEVYAFWRKLENLPLIMKHLDRVEIIDEKHSEWHVKTPSGLDPLYWKAAINADVVNEQISWSSMADTEVQNAGTVKFKEVGENETEISLKMSYKAPLGAYGKTGGKLLNPALERMIQKDFKKFKDYVESEELTKELV